MAISIKGPVLQIPDGFGDVVRQFGLAASEIGCPCEIIDVGSDNEHGHEILKKEFPTLVPLLQQPVTSIANLVITIADLFEHLYVPGKLNLAYAMWETDRLPRYWPALCNRMDAILVPSQFCHDVFRKSGVTVPIEVVPLPVDTAKFDGLEPDTKLFPSDDRLTFYSIFQWIERKNPFTLIWAFLEAFGGNDQVQLIIKTHGHANKTVQQCIVDAVEDAFPGQAKEKLANVRIITNRLSAQQICQLHLAGQVYVGPVRGEGFSIPMFDAALAGNHVIATRFSSHVEFLDATDAQGEPLYDLVDYQLVPVQNPGDTEYYTSEQNWAQVDRGHLVRCLRRTYEAWLANKRQLPRCEDRQRHAAKLRERWYRTNSLRGVINVICKLAEQK